MVKKKPKTELLYFVIHNIYFYIKNILKEFIELLAPGGNIDSIKAAIIGGADAMYCGLDKFNARNKAEKISFNDLQGILNLAHKNNCKVFLTLNIIILENEITAIINLLNKLVNTSIDGVIIQDIGLFYLVSKYFKHLKIHASTQTTTHNEGQIKFLNAFNIYRVNLSRELNINEITHLTTVAKQNNIETEVFVHGSYCISFSGICFISSVQSGNSGNRGRCSQPCRDKYKTTAANKNYPLNLKDNSAYYNLNELIKAGVSSLKIEGRIKKYDYVYTVVNTWRKLIDSYINKTATPNNEALYKVFNRDFTNGFLKNNIGKNMYIDNPKDNSIQHLSDINKFSNNNELEKASLKLYAEKDKIKNDIKIKIDAVNIKKKAIVINVYGKKADFLKITAKTGNKLFEVHSKTKLKTKGIEALSNNIIYSKFKSINDTEYDIEELNINLTQELFLPFKELNYLKNNIISEINGQNKIIDSITISKTQNLQSENKKPVVSVLISSFNDLYLYEETNSEIYFQLPSSLKNNYNNYVDTFKNYDLIPWFPSIIIGEDYNIAINFLKQIKPKKILTNNTGIAYFAFENNINWIAGPQLNIVNSYSLQALKEIFNCSGAFISNEINKTQISKIKRPNNFELYYSIYHPIVTMTSRQCLFQQVTGCEKNIVNNTCIENCEKHNSITNMKQETYFIDKTKDNYNELFNANNFLNTEIITDLPKFFDSFLIDLRNIKTNTVTQLSKLQIIKLFNNAVNKKDSSILHKNIYNTNINQYKKGL